MDTRLFAVDPYASAQYGMYTRLTEGKGSFEDFLIHYDSHSVNKGDFSWLANIVKGGDAQNIAMSLLGNSASWVGMGAANFIGIKSSLMPEISNYNSSLLGLMLAQNSPY
jgi:hypothetical protein